MNKRERSEAVKAVCREHWRSAQGNIERSRKSQRLVFDREPELILDRSGEIVGVDAWVRLFDTNGNEIPIDPHRRIINPPTVPRAGIRWVGEGEDAVRELTPDPLEAFYEAVWDSVESVPNAKGWRTRGTVTTVFGDTADGRIRSNSGTYSTARAGASLNASTVNGSEDNRVGQLFLAGPDFYCWESFFSFDTSAIDDADTVSAVVLDLDIKSRNVSGSDFTVEARDFDWGASLTTADWIAGADLGSHTLVASVTASSGSVGSYQTFTSETAFLTVTNIKTGTVHLVVNSSRHRVGTSPSGDENITYTPADAAGTTDDPKLTITHDSGPPPATPVTGIAVGAKVQAADFPPTVWDNDETAISNVTATTFQNGSPEVSVTFIAPTSGRVLVYNGGGLRNNSGADQMFIDSEIRETDGSGTVVRSSSVTGDGTLSCADESLGFEYKTRAYVQSGLTPGSTYFARLQYRTSTGGGTADITARSIIVQPIP